MCGGRRRIRSRSDVGVSPVLTQARISTSRSLLRLKSVDEVRPKRAGHNMLWAEVTDHQRKVGHREVLDFINGR